MRFVYVYKRLDIYQNHMSNMRKLFRGLNMFNLMDTK